MPKNKITPFDRYFSRPLKAIASLGALAADVSSEIFNAQIAGNQITVSGPNGGMNSIGAISDGHFTPRGNNSGTIIAQEIENGRLVNVSYQLSNYGDGSNTNVIDAGPVSAGQTVMSGSGLVANYQGPEGSVVTSSMINNVANDPSIQGLQVGVGYYPDSFFPTPNDDASAIYNPVVDTVFDIDDDSVRYLLHGSYVDVYQDPRINLPLVIDARTSDPHAVNVTFEGGTVNYQVPNSAIRAIDEDGQDVLVYPGDQRLGGGVVARPISVINHGRWNFETLIGEGPRIGEGYGVEIFSRNQYPVQSISNTQIRSPITEIREYNASDTNIINVPQGVGYVVINGDDQVGDPSLQINIPLDQPSVVSFESEVGTENSIVSVPGAL